MAEENNLEFNLPPQFESITKRHHPFLLLQQKTDTPPFPLLQVDILGQEFLGTELSHPEVE